MTRSIRVRHMKAVALLGAALVAVAACGSSSDGVDQSSQVTAGDCSGGGAKGDPAWQATLDSAQQDGSVEMWSTVNQVVLDRVEDAFETACPGIDARLTAMGLQNMLVRIDAEHDGNVPTVDVVLNSDRVWHAQRNELGYFSRILGPQVIEAQNDAAGSRAPSTSSDGDIGAPSSDRLLYDDDTRLLTLLGPWGYAWNKDAVAESPTFQQLFESADYKGTLGILDPGVAPVVTVEYMLLEQQYPDLLKDLARAEPRIYSTPAEMAQALTAGEIDAALNLTEALVVDTPNVQFAFDDQHRPLATPVYSEIMKAAPQPAAAQVLVNWLLSPEGQRVLTSGYAPVIPEVATSGVSIDDVDIFEPDSFEADVVKQSLQRINGALGR